MLNWPSFDKLSTVFGFVVFLLAGNYVEGGKSASCFNFTHYSIKILGYILSFDSLHMANPSYTDGIVRESIITLLIHY